MSSVHTVSKKTDPFLFLVVSMWVFATSLFILNAIGFVPYYVDGSAPTVSDTRTRTYLTEADIQKQQPALPTKKPTQPVTSTPGGVDPFTTPLSGTLPSVTRTTPDVPFLPEKIIIPALNRELPLVNPVDTDTETLDRELLTAVVRYPGSGLLNTDGNIFIFGHSSHLRTVHNPLFKAFNGIESLPKNSLIQLTGGGRTFVYRVTKQEKVSAETALVDLSVVPGRRLLTLSTCNSFGEKSDRFVVTAEFEVSY